MEELFFCVVIRLQALDFTALVKCHSVPERGRNTNVLTKRLKIRLLFVLPVARECLGTGTGTGTGPGPGSGHFWSL